MKNYVGYKYCTKMKAVTRTKYTLTLEYKIGILNIKDKRLRN